MFTQPLMYKRIRKHPGVMKIFTDKLINEGVIKQEEYEVCHLYIFSWINKKTEWMFKMEFLKRSC